MNNGPIKRQATADITQYEIDPTFVTSISAGYNLGNGGNIEVGASNLFNEYPSRDPRRRAHGECRADLQLPVHQQLAEPAGWPVLHALRTYKF